MSLIYEAAIAEWRRTRADYSLFLEAQHRAASAVCNGALLNARGRAAGVSSFSLFMGPWARAKAYASEELIEFWDTSRRVTFAEFERQSYDDAAADLDPAWGSVTHGR